MKELIHKYLYEITRIKDANIVEDPRGEFEISIVDSEGRERTAIVGLSRSDAENRLKLIKAGEDGEFVLISNN